MKKNVSDLMGMGIFLISIWILTFLTETVERLGLWAGIVGSVMLIIVEGYFLIKSWRKNG